jgi:hypothetical protein
MGATRIYEFIGKLFYRPVPSSCSGGCAFHDHETNKTPLAIVGSRAGSWLIETLRYRLVRHSRCANREVLLGRR